MLLLACGAVAVDSQAPSKPDLRSVPWMHQRVQVLNGRGAAAPHVVMTLGIGLSAGIASAVLVLAGRGLVVRLFFLCVRLLQALLPLTAGSPSREIAWAAVDRLSNGVLNLRI